MALTSKVMPISASVGPTKLPATGTACLNDVTDDHIFCLKDGQEAEHAEAASDDVLRHDAGMVAPNYAKKRQELAVKIGLGRKLRVVEAEPAPAPVVAEPAPAPKPKRSRAKAAA